MDFYSHTPHGVQQAGMDDVIYTTKFLLTHPSRGATINGFLKVQILSFLLTHPSRGATKHCLRLPGVVYFYSHTPHGVQPSRFVVLLTLRQISTHTPLTGCNRKIMYFTANCTPYNVGVDFFKNLY